MKGSQTEKSFCSDRHGGKIYQSQQNKSKGHAESFQKRLTQENSSLTAPEKITQHKRNDRLGNGGKRGVIKVPIRTV